MRLYLSLMDQLSKPVNIGQANGWHTYYNKKLTRKQSLKYKRDQAEPKNYTVIVINQG